MKKKWLAVLSLLAVICIGLAVYIADLARFPGKIRDPGYEAQVRTIGVKSVFHQGVVYHYHGLPPMLEVAGDYHEMGLQYGVLLRSELVKGMEPLYNILKWNAQDIGVPLFAMTALVKFKARRMAAGLPQRYQDEMHGVAEGSGIPYDSIISICLMYDIGMGMDCTGVLMKGRDRSIIQGRNNDTAGFGGEELAKMTVVVRYKATGKNAVTHMDVPYFYMGVETGYNDKGLCFGEETLQITKPNPGGFSLPYLIRMIMEEASSLDEIYPFFDKYPTIAAYGTVWSDLRAGKGVAVEVTPTAWAKNELKKSLLWDFNRFYDSKLAEQQKPACNITNTNIDRDAIATTFPKQDTYTIEDVVKFLRAQTGPDGTDYSWSGTKFPVCNWEASQMMIWDSRSDGFYMATGPYYAARQNIYHYFNDFSRPPELFMQAVPIEPVIEKAARIENRLISRTDKLKAFINLADEYKSDANAQFMVAYKSFRLSSMDTFRDYAARAFALQPANDEYRMYAGLAAYHKQDQGRAIRLLDSVKARYPEQDLIRLTVLEKASTIQDPTKAALYKTQKQLILDKYHAVSYYTKEILPLIDALDKKK